MYKRILRYNESKQQSLKIPFAPVNSENTSMVPTADQIEVSFYDPSNELIETYSSGTYNATYKEIFFTKLFASGSYPKGRNYKAVVNYVTSGSTVSEENNTFAVYFDIATYSLIPLVRAEDIWRIAPFFKQTAYTDAESEVLKYLEIAWESLMDDIWALTSDKTSSIVDSNALRLPHQYKTLQFIYESFQQFDLAKDYDTKYKIQLKRISTQLPLDLSDTGQQLDGNKGAFSIGRVIL